MHVHTRAQTHSSVPGCMQKHMSIYSKCMNSRHHACKPVQTHSSSYTHTGICETCLFMHIEAYMPTHVILQVNVVKCLCLQGFPGDTSGLKNKKPPASAGGIRNLGLIPGSGRSPGRRHGNPLQYSCLETPLDRGAWCATVHRVTGLDTTEAT